MRRVAAIDCGTNSLRLLVTDLDPATGRARDVDRRTTIVRLGQDVDRTGVFAAEALERTFGCLDDYARILAETGPEAVRFIATSAARDVANRDEFSAGVRARVGVEPDVVGGDEEAQLAYDGATRGLVELPDVALPVLVVDIGGGSTEFVTRPDASAPIQAVSLDVGSVRMTERHLRDDPPSDDQIAAAVRDIDRAVGGLGLPLDDVATLVGVAGSVTTMAAMVLGLPAYDPDRIHHAHLSTPDVLAAVDTIVRMSVAERKALGFMHPGRADVIGAGALVLGSVVRRLGLDELVVSEHDILDGIAWSIV